METEAPTETQAQPLAQDLAEMTSAVAGIEVDGLAVHHAEALLAAAVQLSHAAGALAARTALRLGAAGAHRHHGDRSDAHQLARVSGTGLATARAALDAARATDKLTATGQAFRSGELSVRQATALSGAALANPRAEPRLLRIAKARGIGQLEEECARVRACAAPGDEAERYRRARAERGAWTRNACDGSAEIRFRSSADDVAEVWSVVSAFRERLFKLSPAEPPGERPSFDQQSADAFLDMARAAVGAQPPSQVDQPALDLDVPARRRPEVNVKKVVVRVDLAALLRGYPGTGEVCEIPGYGPIPVAAVRDLIETGNPFLAAVLTKGVDVGTVAHLGRAPTAHQRTALEWLNPRCRVEGCDRTLGLEIDHRIDWAPTQITLLGWLEWLCSHHHRLKTNEGWRLVPGRGIRAFVRPEDPRHPNNSPPALAG